MAKEKPFDGTIKFVPRQKNEVDDRADEVLAGFKNPPVDPLGKRAEKAANCIIEKQKK